jgi:class 3 adenylate cyclase
VQPIRYATTSDDVTVAYQVAGGGDVDLIAALGIVTHLEVNWEEPAFARFLSKLASFSRLVLFDKRGVGLSDRVGDGAVLEERMDDVRAVMDAAGSARAVVFGISEGAAASILFAATFPERTKALVVYGSDVRNGWHEDDPASLAYAATREEYERLREDWYRQVRATWGEEPLLLDRLAPSRAGDAAFTAWWLRWLRLSSSPASFIDLMRSNEQIDIRHVLPAIRVPTLVLHRGGDAVPVENGRYLAAGIPGAKFVELPGRDHIAWVGDVDALVGEIEEFATGLRRGLDPERVLTTLLFTDIVSSTERSAELGDHSWRDLLTSHYAAIRRQLIRWRGCEVKTTGDGFLATFDGPARALQCACAVRDEARAIGLEIRAGVHTGEVEVLDTDIAGLAVHLCQRVQSIAAPGEVLASSTVKDLVAGSGLRFEDRGTHVLRGVPGQWHLFAATEPGPRLRKQ